MRVLYSIGDMYIYIYMIYSRRERHTHEALQMRHRGHML